MSPLRVGVLGTGAISQIVHLPILVERDDVDVIAVCDYERHKAQSIAERFDIPQVLDEDELLAHDELDAVFICTPNHQHERQAIAALEAGQHVLVERPVALDAAGARRVVAAADAAGRNLMVGMSHRWRPDVTALRSFVAGGEFGSIYALRVAWLNRPILVQRSTWRQKPSEAGGGALMDLGVQALDLCLWLLDYPTAQRVKAVVHHDQWEVEDAAALMVELSGGVVITAEVAWGHFAAEDRHHVRVMGTEGSGTLPPLEIYKQLGGRAMDVTPRQPKPRGGENPYTNAYRREIDQFVRTVLGQGQTPLPREQEALMTLVEAAYRSAREGHEVDL